MAPVNDPSRSKTTPVSDIDGREVSGPSRFCEGRTTSVHVRRIWHSEPSLSACSVPRLCCWMRAIGDMQGTGHARAALLSLCSVSSEHQPPPPRCPYTVRDGVRMLTCMTEALRANALRADILCSAVLRLRGLRACPSQDFRLDRCILTSCGQLCFYTRKMVIIHDAPRKAARGTLATFPMISRAGSTVKQ